MTEIKLGYFKNFGITDFQKIATNFEKDYPQVTLKLIPVYQDQVTDYLDEGKIDAAITDPRDNDFEKYQLTKLAEVSLIAVLQSGNFMAGQQVIELDQLKKIPNLLIAKTEEEAGELTYHRDLLKIKSLFLAVDSFNEAALMAESGSGYFLMNERTAPLIKSNQLQKLFLLKNGVQLKQEYVFVSRDNNKYQNLIEIAKQIINN